MVESEKRCDHPRSLVPRPTELIVSTPNGLTKTLTFSRLLDVSSAGVSGLENVGVGSGVLDSTEGTRLPTPLDSLPVLGEIGPQPDNVRKPCSYKSLVPSAQKCSGSRPDKGSAIVSAILIPCRCLSTLYLG
ncbi:hypothetical protein KM043_008731 [Ampulex compressa]|nr:hypothetical protein KM043_008731 [Ampulex compressa]